ncbi:MAG: dihydrolipoyl dehydrogenase [Desulfobacula sp.]|uniref:dihydrolipoyl dehydrogenase n=1 Tax=Desulfobacula sp. TaxID=2593537 RepID=UPI002A02F1EC|nr:dihydrolipoyl dehydrogenase [Desulfobacula sp.]
MVVGELVYDTDVVVLGGGPGGYTAAIHAADLGFEVILVESRPNLGGVCLTEGCIPSKTLIHAVGLADALKHADVLGLIYTGFEFDIQRLRNWISSVVNSLSTGILKLLENRDIEIVQGHGRFTEDHKIYIEGANTNIRFKHAIIATGSRINEFPTGIDLPLWSSAEALSLPQIPKSLLVIGGGYIGLEIGQAYAGLGSLVSMVEFNENLLEGADRDLVNVVIQTCQKQFSAIHTQSKVLHIDKTENGYLVVFEKNGVEHKETYDQVLVATGRRPNTDDLGLNHIGIKIDDKGLIPTDDQCRTSIHHIFAVGDVTRGFALAHKASREGKVAAEVIAGMPSAFDNVAVPAVLFTRPEIAWTGLTEKEARDRDIPFKVGKFPLTALGRAKSTGKTKGFVKVIAHGETSLILGVGIVGEKASELISEGTLAIEMGACLEDLIVSIHPHPTFSESIMEAAEMAAQGSVHLFKEKK